MEKKEKKKTSPKIRFNVIDVFILVLVIACIGGIVVRFTILNNLKKNVEEQDYYLSFTVSSLSYDEMIALDKAYDEKDSNGNTVYLSDGTTLLGRITDIELHDRQSFEIVHDNGAHELIEYPDSLTDEEVTWTVSGKIRCSGIRNNDTGFLLGGKQYIGVNSKLDVYTKYSDLSIYITEVKIGEIQ